MNGSPKSAWHFLVLVLWITSLPGSPSSTRAEDFDYAERLYADHCAV
jgi:hypothetical protein